MKQKKLKKKSKAGKRKQKKKAVAGKALDLIPDTKSLTTDIAVLEKAFEGDKEMVLFFLAWLKHKRNATKAYQEVHPDVSERVAAVLGSRKLRKVDISLVLESYGIGVEDYFIKLNEGLNATKLSGTGGMKITMDGKGKINELGHTNLEIPDFRTRRIYHQALGKMLGFESPDIQINNANINQNQNSIDNLNDDELDDLIS